MAPPRGRVFQDWISSIRCWRRRSGAGSARSRICCANVGASSYPFVTETSRHLVDAGGKRFRPLVVLLAAGFGDPQAPAVVPGCRGDRAHAPVDAVPRRRDGRGGAAPRGRCRPTPAGPTRSPSSPATSSSPARRRSPPTSAPRPPASWRRPSRCCARGRSARPSVPAPAIPIAHYRQVVAEKTGSLIATSGRLGALLSGAPPAVVACARRAYGERIGVAFQLSDDLLDITSPSGESGKNPGTDLREGVRTLPVLLRRAGRPRAARRPLR